MSEIVSARVATESNGAFCIGCSNATNGQIPWQVYANSNAGGVGYCYRWRAVSVKII